MNYSINLKKKYLFIYETGWVNFTYILRKNITKFYLGIVYSILILCFKIN